MYLYVQNLPDLLIHSQMKLDDSCIAMLNNFYAEGADSWGSKGLRYCYVVFFQVWYDMAWYHKKWFVCEDSDKLMNFAFVVNIVFHLYLFVRRHDLDIVTCVTQCQNKSTLCGDWLIESLESTVWLLEFDQFKGPTLLKLCCVPIRIY